MRGIYLLDMSSSSLSYNRASRIYLSPTIQSTLSSLFFLFDVQGSLIHCCVRILQLEIHGCKFAFSETHNRITKKVMARFKHFSGQEPKAASPAIEQNPPLDLSHYYSRVTKARQESNVKAFYKYFTIPGIGNLAGGM